MAITDYGSLKTAVADWLVRDDLSARIPDFIGFAHGELMRRLRLKLMETSADLTVESGAVDLPADFLELRRLYLNTDPKALLRFVPPEEFHERYLGTTSGQPRYFTIEGNSILPGPAPDGAYAGKLLYYARFSGFSDDSDTNALLTAAPQAYLYASLLQAEAFLQNDVRIPLWTAALERELRYVVDDDNRKRFAGRLTVGAGTRLVP